MKNHKPIITDDPTFDNYQTARDDGALATNFVASFNANGVLEKRSIPGVSDIAYNATSWNGNTDAATKNAIRDKIETLGGGLSNVVEDTTPQLGGELDAQAHSIGGTVQTTTGDGTTTIDWKLGNMFDFQFGAFSETFTFTAPTKPGIFILKLVQDSVGSRTVTWPGTVKWVDGTAPTLTTTGTTGTDIITFYYNGTSYFAVQSLNFS